MDPQEAERICREAVDSVMNGDAEMAAELFRSAASAGCPEGMFGLAELMASGRGVPKDTEGAAVLYGKAAAAGNIPAAFRLGLMLLSGADPAKGTEYLRLCCNAGFAPAYRFMGDACFDGVGTEKDLSAAAAWYSRASSEGDPEAAFRLGCMYETGTGVPADPGMSVKMFEESASGGCPEAMFKMAVLTYDGTVPGGKGKAFEWYSACSETIPTAAFNAATMLLNGDGVPQDKEKAFGIYSTLADSGDADAMFQTGRMYIDGEGVGQNAEEGFRRIGKAARMGNAEAVQLVDGLRRRQNTQMIHIDGAEE